MARYVLANDAEDDLANIADYTIENFGIQQSRYYRDDLFRTFESLIDNPLMGRDYGHVIKGVRRHKHKKHSIYYTTTDKGILILRILHERQDPAQHF